MAEAAALATRANAIRVKTMMLVSVVVGALVQLPLPPVMQGCAFLLMLYRHSRRAITTRPVAYVWRELRRARAAPPHLTSWDGARDAVARRAQAACRRTRGR